MSVSNIPTPKIPSNRKKDGNKIVKKTNNNTIKKWWLPTPPSRSILLEKKKENWTKKNISSFVVLSIFVILWWLLWIYRWNILWIIWWTQTQQLVINQDDDVLFVGKNIEITGNIQKISTRKYKYTHTIDNQEYGILGLRSSNINLNNISGNVLVQWQIIDFINNIYVIDVREMVTTPQDKENLSWAILYFPLPWLLIQNMAAAWFTITTQESTTINSILINNTSTKAQITIRSFACSPNQAYDCQRFQSTFESTVGVQFTDSYNNKFYKLNDANTWFVNIDNRYGVYIETSSEALLTMMIQNIQFISDEWAKKTLTPLAKTLCTWSGNTLNEITQSNIIYKNNDTIRNIQWVSQNYEPILCILSIKPLDLKSSSIISFDKKPWQIKEEIKSNKLQETIATGDTISPSADISLSNPNTTKQIPLKLGKELLFSTRGVNISFPTPNIAFESTNINKTVKGLSCFSSSNIVLYWNKNNIKNSPSVTVYFCKNGKTIDTNNVKTITIWETTILIELLDPAWVDFVNNIKIS